MAGTEYTTNYKKCTEYFGGGICALDFLWCPHWTKENGIYVPKGCEDKLSKECIYHTKEEQNDLS